MCTFRTYVTESKNKQDAHRSTLTHFKWLRLITIANGYTIIPPLVNLLGFVCFNAVNFEDRDHVKFLVCHNRRKECDHNSEKGSKINRQIL